MKQPATTEEILHGQVLTLESLIRILERKGLLSKDELMQEVVKVRDELHGKHGIN